MSITSASIYKLLQKMSGYKSLSIYSDLVLSQSSGNRFRAGYANFPTKPGWWPNQCKWFCSAVNIDTLYNNSNYNFIKTTQAFPLKYEYDIIIGIQKQEIRLLEAASPQHAVKKSFTYEKAAHQYTFPSCVFDTLRRYYNKINCDLDRLDKILDEILADNPIERKRLKSYNSADDKFGFLINECLRNSNSSSGMFEWARQKNQAPFATPVQQALNEIKTREHFLATIYSTLKSGKTFIGPEDKIFLNMYDLLDYMDSSYFQIHLSPNDYINIINICKQSYYSDYTIDWCDLALSKYPKVYAVLEEAISEALRDLNFSKALQYVDQAKFEENNLPKSLLEQILDCYENSLLCGISKPSVHIQNKLRELVDLYSEQFPESETYFFNKAENLLVAGKVDDAEKLLLEISNSTKHAPACCALYISLILQKGEISTRMARHIISITIKGIADCPHTRPDLLGYFYLQRAKAKEVLYIDNLACLPAHQVKVYDSVITPLDIRNDYNEAYRYYAYICSQIKDPTADADYFIKKIQIEDNYRRLRNKYSEFPPLNV